jgi:O-antigen/teichoic acid export membrane protein
MVTATAKSVGGFKQIKNLLSDNSLTQKATLNAFAAFLDYGARLIVGFIITPLLVAGLGSYFYGTWQILNRLVGYISPTSGRPSQALKWTLAGHQSSVDYDQKRRYVGSAVAVWVLFLPVMTVLGGMLAWFVPYWAKTQIEYFWHVRIAAGILVANLIMASLATVPQSVMSGENLGYKRMGLSAGLVFVGGGLTWMALYLGAGIVGVAAAAFLTTLLTGAFFLLIMRHYVPWFGLVMPSFGEIRQFLGLSGWFLGWNIIMKLMLASDVVILGFLASPEIVTTYSLTKYVPETLISIVAMITFGIAPGLGGIVGSGNLEKAASIRGELMALTWLIVTALGCTILVWNRTFVELWVGAEHYSGSTNAFLIVLIVTQFVLIRNDANFIDLTLWLRSKVVLGALSAMVSIVGAAVLVGYFRLEIMGLCLGIIAGRCILSAGYPVLVGRHLRIKFSSQLKSVLRPIGLTVLLYMLAYSIDTMVSLEGWHGLMAWIGLALSTIVTSVAILILLFYLGLSGNHRNSILLRLRAIVTKP